MIPEKINKLSEEKSPIKPEASEIFRYWNGKKIIQHKAIRGRLEKSINRVLKQYTVEEIKEAIDHYAIMYFDEDYGFCDYKWSLRRLLQEINGMEEFLNDGNKWINYCRVKERQPKRLITQLEERTEEPLPSECCAMDAVNSQYCDCLTTLKSIPYEDYLKTDHWQHFRAEALKNAHHTCQLCGNQNLLLDVHHRTYRNKGRETFLDVIVLCRECHEMFHKNKDKPECTRCLEGTGEHEIMPIA